MSLRIQGTTVNATSTADLNLGVNNFTNALVVSGTTGNVGIGTNNPQYSLDVRGDLNFSPIITIPAKYLSVLATPSYNANLPLKSSWSIEQSINPGDYIYDQVNIVIPQGATIIEFEMIGAGGYGFGSTDSTNNDTFKASAINQGGTGAYFKGTIDVSKFIGETLTIQVGRCRNTNQNVFPFNTSSTASFICIKNKMLFVIAGAGGNGCSYYNRDFKGGNGGGGTNTSTDITISITPITINGNSFSQIIGKVINGTNGVAYIGLTEVSYGGTTVGGIGTTSTNPPNKYNGSDPGSSYIDARGGYGSNLSSYGNGGNGYAGGGGGSASGGGGSSFYNSTYVTITSTKTGPSLTSELSGYGRSSQNGYVYIKANAQINAIINGSAYISNTLNIGTSISGASVNSGAINGTIKFQQIGSDPGGSIEQRIYSYGTNIVNGNLEVYDKSELFIYKGGDGHPGNTYGPERIRLKAGEIRFDTYDINSYPNNALGQTKYDDIPKMIIRPDGKVGIGGNVGIGTDNPSEKLHVIGNTTITDVLTIQSTTCTGFVKVFPSGNSKEYGSIDMNGYLKIFGKGQDQNGVIYNVLSSDPGGTCYFNTGGGVAIGTTDTNDYKLNVNGSTQIQSKLTIYNNSSQPSGNDTQTSDLYLTTTKGQYRFSNTIGSGGGLTDSHLQLYSYFPIAKHLLDIDKDGNIGICKETLYSNPYKLDVNGSINCTSFNTSGNATLSGNALLSGYTNISGTAILSGTTTITGNTELKSFLKIKSIAPITYGIEYYCNTTNNISTINDTQLGYINFSGYNSGEKLSASIKSYQDVDSASYAPGRLSFFTTNTTGISVENMTIKNNGNVGIGTKNPSEKLHVANGTLLVSNSIGDTSGYVKLYTMPFGSYGNMDMNGNFKMYRPGSNTISSNYFSCELNGNSYFNTGGYLGIGTDNPSYKLHVNGTTRIEGVTDLRSDTNINGLISINNNYENTRSISFYKYGNNSIDGTGLGRIAFYGISGTTNYKAAEIAVSQDGATSGTNIPGKIVFNTNNGSNFTERMIIKNDGNVGIGGDPSANGNPKLYVNGNVGIGGDPTVNGNPKLYVNGTIRCTSIETPMKYKIKFLNDTTVSDTTMAAYTNNYIIATPTADATYKLPATNSIGGITSTDEGYTPYYKIANRATSKTITIQDKASSTLVTIYPSQIGEIIAIDSGNPGKWFVAAP